MKTLQAPPDFPVPQFDDIAASFGAPLSAYLSRFQLGEWGRDHATPFHEIANMLLFYGGKLADHGLAFKPDIDLPSVTRALRALLISFEPPHEIKICTVAVALANWCERVEQ